MFLREFSVVGGPPTIECLDNFVSKRFPVILRQVQRQRQRSKDIVIIGYMVSATMPLEELEADPVKVEFDLKEASSLSMSTQSRR